MDESTRQAFEQMDEEQATALQDGRASRGDYEAAVRRARQCLEGLGMKLSSGPLVGDDGTANLAGHFPGSVEQVDVDGCGRLIMPISSVYILQHQRSTEEREHAAVEAVGCLDQVGVSVPPDSNSRQVLEAAGAVEAGDEGVRNDVLDCVEPLQTVSVSPPGGIDQALADWLQRRE